MNTSALIVMLTTITLVTGLMINFFIKVLSAPPRPEPDSYVDNDNEPELQVPNQ